MQEAENYRDISGVNQSSLKKLLFSPQSYLKAVEAQQNPDESKESHFVFGSVLDIMLVGNKEEFDNKFIKVSDEVSCSETVQAIVKNVYDYVSNIIEISGDDLQDFDQYSEQILKYAREAGYQNNYKDETLVNTVVKQGAEYFKTLRLIGKKTPVSATDYSKAVNCKAALLSDPFTALYVNKKNAKNTDFLDRFVVQFTYEGVEIKGELDRVVVRHDTKIIIPIDFKSTGKSVYDFKNDFFKYRYDFQAATYRQGLYNHPDIIKLLNDGYQIASFLFIVVEKDLQNPPLVFAVSPEVEAIGLTGGITSRGQELEGFHQAIQRYKYHTEENVWEYPVEYYLNEGYLIINP